MVVSELDEMQRAGQLSSSSTSHSQSMHSGMARRRVLENRSSPGAARGRRRGNEDEKEVRC